MTVSTSLASPFSPHWNLYPRSYVAQRVTVPLQIDGDLTKPVWQTVPWSEAFGDITGDDTEYLPALTRFKALWDDDHLYIGAELHPSKDFNTQAHYTERNSPIYQLDSDFEVFCDVTNTHYDYKELEVNALNTVWNLLLDKPYLDGGAEHSGRVAKPGEALYYDVYHQTTATKVIQGTLNDPHGTGALWTVEMALAYTDLFANTTMDARVPHVNSWIRINFSRVELQGKVNWTWQPQRAWNATVRRYTGQVNMHLPDAWGYLVFGNKSTGASSTPAIRDPTWPGRVVAMQVYYAQHWLLQTTGSFTYDVNDLLPYMDADIVRPFDIQLQQHFSNGFVARVVGNPNGSIISITNDRFLQVYDVDADQATSL